MSQFEDVTRVGRRISDLGNANPLQTTIDLDPDQVLEAVRDWITCRMAAKYGYRVEISSGAMQDNSATFYATFLPE